MIEHLLHALVPLHASIVLVVDLSRAAFGIVQRQTCAALVVSSALQLRERDWRSMYVQACIGLHYWFHFYQIWLSHMRLTSNMSHSRYDVAKQLVAPKKLKPGSAKCIIIGRIKMKTVGRKKTVKCQLSCGHSVSSKPYIEGFIVLMVMY